jgi:hypothetical protein
LCPELGPPAGFRARKGVTPGAYIQGMATIVQCNCGAKYRRTEEKSFVPHTGDAVCTVCGAALESWLESTHVPKIRTSLNVQTESRDDFALVNERTWLLLAGAVR